MKKIIFLIILIFFLSFECYCVSEAENFEKEFKKDFYSSAGREASELIEKYALEEGSFLRPSFEGRIILKKIFLKN